MFSIGPRSECWSRALAEAPPRPPSKDQAWGAGPLEAEREANCAADIGACGFAMAWLVAGEQVAAKPAAGERRRVAELRVDFAPARAERQGRPALGRGLGRVIVGSRKQHADPALVHSQRLGDAQAEPVILAEQAPLLQVEGVARRLECPAAETGPAVPGACRRQPSPAKPASSLKVEEQALRTATAERLTEVATENRVLLVKPGQAGRQPSLADAAIDGQAGPSIGR